jgi:adenylate cyclase
MNAERTTDPPRPWPRRFFDFGQRRPVACILLITLISNVFATIFNIVYNHNFIVTRSTPAQKEIFFQLVMLYNPIAFPIGLGWIFRLALPIYRHHHQIMRGEMPSAEELTRIRESLLRLPTALMVINSLCWLTGALVFPACICWFGGSDNAAQIWVQFLVSFGVGMALTVVQTLFFVEEFLIWVLYPVYFRDARPADYRGGLQSFFWRMILFWSALAVAPMIGVAALAANLDDRPVQFAFFLTILGGLLSGLLISGLVGWSIWRWLKEHQQASERIGRGDFDTRVGEKRSDEFGKLSDRFNEMAAGLQQGEKVRETFGQFAHPEIRDEIMERFLGVGGEVKFVTVMFIDIRGFTKRSAGESPDKVFDWLNRFATLSLSAVEENHGWVNKFLGDGLMAIFGVRRSSRNHADEAVDAALDVMHRLQVLNDTLKHEGHPPLPIGIGIHTGDVLYGCIGAAIDLPDGQTTYRREITAIGETVNLASRIEQLTKTIEVPALLSGFTKKCLTRPFPLESHGEHKIRGYDGTLEIYSIAAARGRSIHRGMEAPVPCAADGERNGKDQLAVNTSETSPR